MRCGARRLPPTPRPVPRPTASSPHSGHYVVEPPPVRFARSGDARIAFRVMGEGPLNVVGIGGPASHLDIMLEDPEVVRVQQRFASFARLLRDRQGPGGWLRARV